MNTKRIISIAIMLALPFTARGDYTYNVVNTPAQVAVNGTVTLANSSGPYVTVTPTPADESHIATTAYVKGAYNDAIAAVNGLLSEVEVKQGKLQGYDGDYVDVILYGADDIITVLADANTNSISASEMNDYEHILPSTAGLVNGIKSQRVEIYTNWDDDDATTDVALKTVLPDD